MSDHSYRHGTSCITNDPFEGLKFACGIENAIVEKRDDEQLRRQVVTLVTQITGAAVLGTNEDVKRIDKYEEDLITLILQEREVFAFAAVGKLESHNEQCRYYRISHQNSRVCLCKARHRNQLRLEIRKDIKENGRQSNG